LKETSSLEGAVPASGAAFAAAFADAFGAAFAAASNAPPKVTLRINSPYLRIPMPLRGVSLEPERGESRGHCSFAGYAAAGKQRRVLGLWRRRKPGFQSRANAGGRVYNLEPRIERMYRRDRLIAILLVLLLMATLGCVYGEVSRWVSAEVRITLALSGALLMLFNAAAIAAMLKHNREDRTFIYSLDIKHLDEHRTRR
jgi:hypothetical protein